MGNVVINVDTDRAINRLRQLENSQIKEFLDLVKRSYQKKPSQKDLTELEKWMKTYPDLWEVIFDVAHIIEDNFIRNMTSANASIIALQKNTNEIRNEMGYEEASIMERMLIDDLVISWLGVQNCNYQLMARMGRDEKIVILEFWEKRLSIAQRRYLHACETLAKVRRLMAGKPSVQVNIAAQGGQQLNIAGDLVKK